MAETKRTTIIDREGNNILANVVESSVTPGIYGLVALNADGSSIGGGSSLPTYPIMNPTVILENDGLNISIISNTIVLSDGKQYFDFGASGLALPELEVPNGYAGPVTLYAIDNGGTLSYEFVTAAPVDLMALTPPISLPDIPAKGDIVKSWVAINFSGSTKTLGVDPIEMTDNTDWSLQSNSSMDNTVTIQKNPAFCLDGTNQIASNVAVNLSGGDGFGDNPAGTQVLTDYIDGQVVPNGEDGVYAILRNDMVAQYFFVNLRQSVNVGQFVLCGYLYIENNTGSDFTWSPSYDLSGIVAAGTVSCEPVLPGDYLGVFNATTDPDDRGIELFDGNYIFVTGQGYYIYNNGTRYPMGGDGSTSFVADSGYDFSNEPAQIRPVAINSSGEVVPIYDIVSSSAGPRTTNLSENVVQVVIDSVTAIQLCTYDNGGGSTQLYATTFKYNLDKGNWQSITSSAIGFANGIDPSQKPTGAKIDDNKVLIGYNTVAGEGAAALLDISSPDIVVLWDEILYGAGDVSELSVIEGWMPPTGGSNRSPYNNLIIAGIDNNTNLFFTAQIQVTNNRTYIGVSTSVDTYGISDTDAAGYQLCGRGWGILTSGAMMLTPDKTLRYLDFDNGNVVASNNIVIGAAISSWRIRVINGSLSQWAISMVLSTTELYYTTTTFDGVNVNVETPELIDGINADRVTTQYSCDIVPLGVEQVCMVYTVTVAGAVKNIERWLVPLSAGITPGALIDSNTISIDMGTSYVIDCQLLRVQLATSKFYNDTIAYVNNNSNSAAVFMAAWSSTALLSNRPAMPQYDKTVGVINTIPNSGVPVTVYTNGALIAQDAYSGLPGDILYGRFDGTRVGREFGSMKIGEVIDSYVKIDIQPVRTTQWLSKQTVDMPPVPPDTILLQNSFDTKRVPMQYQVPMTIKNLRGTNGFEVNMAVDKYRYSANPLIGGLDKYLAIGSIDDVVTIQKNRDYAYDSAYIVSNIGKSKPFAYDATNAFLFSGGFMTIPVQYKNCTDFTITHSSITIDRIYGMDVGKKFTLRNSSGTPFNISIGTSASEGLIIADTWRDSIDIDGANDRVTLEVNPDYSLGIVEYVKFGKVVDLQAMAETVVQINSADILTGNSNPVQLLPSPGANKIYDLQMTCARMTSVTTPYATNTDWYVAYAGQSIANGLFVDFTTLSSATDIITIPATNSPEPLANTAVQWIVDAGNPTAGDGTLLLYIKYKTVSLI